MDHTSIPKEEEKKNYPWWISWIKPHQGSTKNDYIVKCSCGRVMWLHSPNKVRRHHIGCSQTPIVEGTLWEFFKMKTGLLRCRTLSECFKDFMEGKAK